MNYKELINNRYSRQILFKPIGEEGQKKLIDSRVLILGCGALGTNIANILARAGVGFLRIIDRDFVELSNLQRQNLFNEDDVKQNLPKSVAAKNAIALINSEVTVDGIVKDVDFTNIEQYIEDVDLVMDGTDNFETRFLLNDVCVKYDKPWVYGGCVGSYGIVMPVIPGKTPCLRCIFDSPPPPGMSPTCDTAGIINTIAVIIATYQANEALKILTDNITALSPAMLSIDTWLNQINRLKVKQNTKCPTCVKKEFDYLNSHNTTRTTSLCGRNAVQLSFPNSNAKVDFSDLSKRLEKNGKVSYNKFLLKFYVEDYELTIFHDGRAIIKGTNDITKAKTVYSKYIGN